MQLRLPEMLCFLCTIRDWNNLPPELAQNRSLGAFKAKAAKHFFLIIL